MVFVFTEIVIARVLVEKVFCNFKRYLTFTVFV